MTCRKHIGVKQLAGSVQNSHGHTDTPHGITTSPAAAVAMYCDEHVWCVCVVCVSVREHISRTTRAIFINFSVRVAYGRGLVLLRQGEGAILGVVRAIQKHWQSSLYTAVAAAFAAKGISPNRQ